jgi:hypothetical protein
MFLVTASKACRRSTGERWKEDMGAVGIKEIKNAIRD